jgi:hypothetical protein
MKTPVLLRLLAGLAAAALWPGPAVHAAPFDAGSDGSYGALVVPQGVTTNLALPADGVFRCTTITVAQGATLRFTKNPLNTPVVLLAQGDVVIGGTLDLTGGNASGAIPGTGGPGGFGGGYGGGGPAAPASRGGDGHGPGRGLNASNQRPGAHATAGQSNNRTYGNVLIVPLIGGSGAAGTDGNPGSGGGGGGGAILVASSTRITVNGSINAYGGYAPFGGGSGGAIRLVAPTGGGGGSLHAGVQTGSGEGRVRVDTTDPLAFRNLTIYGSLTRGTRMFALPPPPPLLHIVGVAGQAIPVGAAAGVSFELPAGTPAAQAVVLRGEGFTGNVPVQVTVTPEHSASAAYDAVLNAAATPAEVTVNVTLPVGEPVQIHAWTK